MGVPPGARSCSVSTCNMEPSITFQRRRSAAFTRHTFYKQRDQDSGEWRGWFILSAISKGDTAMAAQTKPIPEGYHTLTPYLVVDGAEKIVRFMKEAFGAQAVFEPMMRPDGKIMHAEFKIGDSVVMIADASERARPTSAMLHVYVPHVDAVYQKALKAGATP